MRSTFRGSVAAATMFVVTLIPLGAIAAERNEPSSVQAEKVARPDNAPAGDATGYRAERAIVRDEKTGALRKPTPQETADLVRTLKTLTRRSELKPTANSDGTQVIEFEGEYEMVVLARATEDGSYETLCVSTFDEGAAFLGLNRIEPPKSGTGAQQ